MLKLVTIFLEDNIIFVHILFYKQMNVLNKNKKTQHRSIYFKKNQLDFHN